MYTFRQIKKEEIQTLFDLIMARVRWMDEVGIQQWNKTKYDECYPPAYFEAHRQAGHTFVLVDEQDQILAGAVLKDEDDRWDHIPGAREDSAVYLHNFATRLGHKGIGSVFLSMAEDYAKRGGVRYFRLDSAVGNEKLTEYYSSRGYVPVGGCVDALYTGILRQKEL